MVKQVWTIVVFNVAIAVFYSFYTFAMWNFINGFSDGVSHWDAIGVMISLPQGVPGVGYMFNVPFWLFWVMMAGNLYFIIQVQRRKEPQK